MENETYKILLANLAEIKNAIEGLSQKFWLDGNFWISFISTAILSATLVYLIKYTKATQEMKSEMVHQRVMSNAHDVRFRLNLYYLSKNPKDIHFGELRANEYKNSIVKFIFLDHKGKLIGRSTKFYKEKATDFVLKSNYFIEEKGGRTRFLKTLQKKKGKIEALVETSVGDKFIYTYETMEENWKILLKGKKGKKRDISDNFILIRKRHKS